VELIRKIPSELSHKLSIGQTKLLFKWLEDLCGIEELSFDNFRMVAGSRSNLAFKPTRACQDTLRERRVN